MQHSTKASKPWDYELRFFRYWPPDKRSYESAFIMSHESTHLTHLETDMITINRRAPTMLQILPHALFSFHCEVQRGLVTELPKE